mmetsp:Transcript_34682/g.108940  ORF Transcript_34682/g.108940 Transcript_34682/m.108940 type:complete len:227 (+) Transcript_34682:535-1215(+)
MNLPLSKCSRYMQPVKKARNFSEVGSQGMFTSQPRSKSILITSGSESSCHEDEAHNISQFPVSALASSSACMVAIRSAVLPPTMRATVASNCRSVRPRFHAGKRFSHSRTLRLFPQMAADMRASYLCTVTAYGFARASSKTSTVSKSAWPIAATTGVKPLNMQGRSGMFCFKAMSMLGTSGLTSWWVVTLDSSTSSCTARASPENAAHKSSEHPVCFAAKSSAASQ